MAEKKKGSCEDKKSGGGGYSAPTGRIITYTLVFGALSFIAVIGLESSYPTNRSMDVDRLKLGCLQVRDLNRNGMMEKFYEINGKKYFSVVDGEDLEDSLKSIK